MGMGLVASWVAAVREAVGMPPKPGDGPNIVLLGLYEATVQTCADDGSTCDVQPFASGLPGTKNVEVRAGIPGATAVVAPGALVLLGWKGGDESQPYCMPAWGQGATVTKMALNTAELELAGNGHPLPLWDTFLTDFVAWVSVLNTLIGTLVPGTGATGGPAYASAIALPASLIVKLALPTSPYESTKVKNG